MLNDLIQVSVETLVFNSCTLAPTEVTLYEKEISSILVNEISKHFYDKDISNILVKKIFKHFGEWDIQTFI